MTKRIFTLLLLSGIALTGCNKNSGAQEEAIKFISPIGAPALAFYDQGNNPYYDTKSVPSQVAAQLQKKDYDIVVFDSINGLKSIKMNEEENGLNYKLAKIITGGNFHLVCVDKEKDEQGNYPLPTSEDKIVSFGAGLIPDLVYNKLASDLWHINNTPKYFASNEEIKSVLTAGVYRETGNPDPVKVDYAFIAEPALTAVENNSEADTYGRIGRVRNIRKDWKELTGQDGLAQAGVFVNTNTLEAKPNNLKAVFKELDTRLKVSISSPDVVAASLNLYGDATTQQSRFGFNAGLVNKVQKNGENGFGMVSPDESIDVNAFLEALGQPTFESKYFVNI